jgi:hypothetical protein
MDWLRRLEKVPEINAALNKMKDKAKKDGTRVTAEMAYRVIEGMWLKFGEEDFEVPSGTKSYSVPQAWYPTRVACEKAQEAEIIEQETGGGDPPFEADGPPSEETLALAKENWASLSVIEDEGAKVGAFKAAMGEVYSDDLLEAVKAA